MLLAQDLAAKLVLLRLFLFQELVAPFLKPRKALSEPPRRAPVEPDCGVGDIFKETPVMRDQHDGRAQPRQLAFQPFDRRQVEMVGRLVEQQNVRLRRQHLGQSRPPRLAAGQGGGVGVAVKLQMFEQMRHPVRVIRRAKPRLDIGLHIGEAVKIRRLRQIADGGGWLAEDFAACRLDEAGGDFQER